MARESWLPRIRNAATATPAQQIVILRGLKNELVGHPPKKEVAVASGVLDTIVRLTVNKATARNSDGKSHDHTFASRPLTEEEMVRLQGLQIVASISLGRIPRPPRPSIRTLLLIALQEDRPFLLPYNPPPPCQPSCRTSARRATRRS